MGTELGYRQVLLVSFGISVLALLTVLGNLVMEIDPKTKDYNELTEALPLILLVVKIIELNYYNYISFPIQLPKIVHN